MKKKINKTLVITTVVCLLPILLSLALYNRLPEKVPIHFDVHGQPDNYAPKAIAAFLLPVGMAVFNFVLQFFLGNDPKQENAGRIMRQITKWIIPVMCIILMPVTLFSGLGVRVPVHLIVPGMIGLLLIIIGNYLPKCKQNYTIGIKLPWTLNSQENWNRTHHIAGYLWIAGGIILIISGLFSLLILPLITMILMVIIPSVYSYLLYKKGI